jgi:hypothetical protein
MSQLEQQS